MPDPDHKSFDELWATHGLDPTVCHPIVLPRNSVLIVSHKVLCGFTRLVHGRPKQAWGDSSVVLSMVVHTWGMRPLELRAALEEALANGPVTRASAESTGIVTAASATIFEELEPASPAPKRARGSPSTSQPTPKRTNGQPDYWANLADVVDVDEEEDDDDADANHPAVVAQLPLAEQKARARERLAGKSHGQKLRGWAVLRK